MWIPDLQKSAQHGSDDAPFRVLYPQTAEQFYTLHTCAPPPTLSGYVELFWVMHWQLAEGESFDAEVIPSAYTNFTCMGEGPRITGVTTNKYEYTVSGAGTIVGAMFKPGGLFPFYQKPLRDLTDAHIHAGTVFDIDDAFNVTVLASEDTQAVRLVADCLQLGADHLPSANNGDGDGDVVNRINTIIEYAQTSRNVSVHAVAHHFGYSERALQQLFSKHVGVGLKWVMLRDRLQRATLIADRGTNPDWLDVAINLGYHDHSHFINDFKRIVGVSPGKYASRPADDQ